jgi:DNA invertase Pin-like site-specific DNA recombinase
MAAAASSNSTGGIVAYYRVSTTRQAVIGLSLKAQKDLVRDYAAENRLSVLEEHTEVESAYGSSKITLEKRPELAAALKTCRKLKATLVIAALDRLARNVVFIASLVETRIKFVALDIPGATPFMIHICAAVAEEESRQRGELIRAAHAMAKARGDDRMLRGILRHAELYKANAEKLRGVVEEIRSAGTRSSTGIAKELNRRGRLRSNGKLWDTQTARILLKSLGLYESPKIPPWERSKVEARRRNKELAVTVSALSTRRTRTQVAEAMNARGLKTARGLSWTARRIETMLKAAKRYGVCRRGL